MRCVLSILALFVMLNSLFLGIAPLSDTASIGTSAINSQNKSEVSIADHSDYRPPSRNEEVEPIDFGTHLDAYKDKMKSVVHHSLIEGVESFKGLDYVYEVSGSKLTIRIDIESYSVATYSFDEGDFQSVLMGGTQQSSVYGSPVVPYRNLLLAIPEYTHFNGINVQTLSSEVVSNLDLVPGPKPVALYKDVTPDSKLFFNPDFYEQNNLLNSEIVEYRIVEQREEEGLFLTIKPLQYNPMKKNAVINSEIIIEVAFDNPISLKDLPFNGSGASGTNYTIIIEPGFESAIADFVAWKTAIGFNVFVETLDDIFDTYPGYDPPEMVRNFINASYTENHTSYVFLIGDGDVVPVREVVDPYWGPGIDNGTEPSDLYYECLDGDWDLNGNHMYGEMNDSVDLFPELMVGRIPVQTYAQAERVLSLIIQYESNPVSGDWMDNFMLIANDCFGYGDGPVMTEDMVNHKYLYDSFFDVSRFYSTDGSLSTSNVVSAINSGVGIIDFFDHGAYDQWTGAMMTSDVMGLSNGNMSMFAFAMACETAAFDFEVGEPVIAEAFFRNPNGGAAAYIGATRVAWASSEAFDGFHNLFWDYFLERAVSEREANPKMAFHQALNYMVTTYDVTSEPTLETVYQAIYFGDPSMNMYWKQNFTSTASKVDIQETVQLNGTLLSYNNVPFANAHAVVTVTDPMGSVATSSPIISNPFGEYSITFNTTNYPGIYNVRTQVADPFDYTGVTSFTVGLVDVTLQLDNDPIYNTFLQFSGTAIADCTGNASLIDSSGTVVQTSTFSVSGGTYSSFLNLTAFGDLRLYIQLDNGTTYGGTELSLRVNRGDILVIADNAGSDWIDYPGGWADDNVGDGANSGDFASALKDEYNITVFYPIYQMAPTISYLREFDAVFVSTGDNIGYPLSGPLSYLLDVLEQYHNEGGHILFEGASILTVLISSEPSRFPNLFHVEYVEYTENLGSLELVKSSHPIMSGMPTNVPLADGLGTVYADVFNPVNGSTHAAAYGGSYVGGTAISGLAPSSGVGGVVFIGFSIDAIEDEATRDLLVTNAAAFLLQPSLIVSMSDDALQTGTTETIYFEVTDAATGAPIKSADISLEGCGITAVNTTLLDGICSISITPTSEGIIEVNVTKGGYLNFTTGIIVYDTPMIALRAEPAFLEPYATQVITIIATDYYELFPLVGCYINATGLGNSVDGYTNSSGMLDLTLTPNDGGQIFVNGTLAGYISSVIGLPVRMSVVVLPSYGTMYPEDFVWDHLMSNWEDYGSMPLDIDYTTFATEDVTLAKLEELDADVLYLGYPIYEYTSAEIEAIQYYTAQGHGLIVSSTAFYMNPEWGSFFGLADDMVMDAQVFSPLIFTLENTSHPLFAGVSNPYSPAFGGTIYPVPSLWDGSVLRGATYLAQDSGGYATILTYRGLVYFSNLPEFMGNTDDCQLAYNAIVWSEYVIPDHDLSVSLGAPQQSNPNEEVLLNVTVYNMGLNDEVDVTAKLFIDEVEVDSLFVPLFENGTTATFQYSWTPVVETIYNVTAVVEPVAGEYSYLNNIHSQMVNIKFLKDYLMVEGAYNWYDAVTNGENLYVSGDDTYVTVPLPFSFPYYDDVFDMVYVSSNGWMSFTYPSPYEFVNPEFPSSDPMHAYCMAPLWDDLQASNNIYLWTTPDRVVIQFNEYEYLGGSDIGTFQVVLHAGGLIEFNYLILYTIYDATVGLNHGDGIHYNSYPADTMDGFSEFGIQFTYETPEHDLSASLSAPERVWLDVPVEITATVVNTGNNTESNFYLRLFIDGSQVESLYIASLAPFHSESIVYEWTPTSVRVYNLTAAVDVVLGEYSTTNNVRTRLVEVEAPREFNILTPSESEIVSGGTVHLEYSAVSPDEIYYIEVYVNDDYITDVFYTGYQEFMVPVFQNGTNEISIVAYWYDMASAYASVTFESVDVVPILTPVPGDYYNYMESYGQYQYARNFTFNDMISDFVVEVDAVYVYYDSGVPVDTMYTTMHVNILNGYIEYDLVGMMGMHLFFMTCMDSPVTTGELPEIGDPIVMEAWFNMYYISSYTIWNGYAVWTLTQLGSGDQVTVFRSNGVLATHSPYGEVVDTSFFPETDTSPPVWLTEPGVIYVEAGEDLEHQFEVYDDTGINGFSVNNSLFRVTQTGLLTNRVALDVGVYMLQLVVTDPFGNQLVGIVTVIVQDTTPPEWIDHYVNVTISLGDVLQLRVLAEDFSGIDHYSVNNTRFTMNNQGWLTSIVQLDEGLYPLLVTVYDIYENMNTMEILIIVEREGGAPPPDIMFLAVLVGVFTVVAITGFAFIFLLRKRMRGGSG